MTNVDKDIAVPCKDLISRQKAINAIENTECELLSEEWDELTNAIMNLPPAQPEREVARMVIGKSKGGVTLWSECNKCGEPVDPDDNFCRNCGRRFVIDE